MTDLTKDFEKTFEKSKKEIGFKPSLNEIDAVFYIRDFINKEGYISTEPFKQVCRRIIDVYSMWLQYMHGLIMPNPGNVINMTEAQLYSEEEKEKIGKMIDKIMVLTTSYNSLMLEMNNKSAKAFIEDACSYWKNELSLELKKMLKKSNEGWNEKFNSKQEKKKKDSNNMFG